MEQRQPVSNLMRGCVALVVRLNVAARHGAGENDDAIPRREFDYAVWQVRPAEEPTG
jgi:hypothetical protein